MSHPIEEKIRKAYDAFGRGDVDGYLAQCTEDFTFNVQGKGGIAGTYIGKTGVYDLAGKAMAITGGTFHEDVEDVLAKDNYAVVLVRHQFNRDGAAWDYKSAHLYEIVNGKLAGCRELPFDAVTFDEAWGLPDGTVKESFITKTPPVPVLIKRAAVE